MDTEPDPSSSEARALARFVARVQVTKPDAWKCVERLKVSCAHELPGQFFNRDAGAGTAEPSWNVSLVRAPEAPVRVISVGNGEIHLSERAAGAKARPPIPPR